jgi:hypothetical protein
MGMGVSLATIDWEFEMLIDQHGISPPLDSVMRDSQAPRLFD